MPGPVPPSVGRLGGGAKRGPGARTRARAARRTAGPRRRLDSRDREPPAAAREHRPPRGRAIADPRPQQGPGQPDVRDRPSPEAGASTGSRQCARSIRRAPTGWTRSAACGRCCVARSRCSWGWPESSRSPRRARPAGTDPAVPGTHRQGHSDGRAARRPLRTGCRWSTRRSGCGGHAPRTCAPSRRSSLEWRERRSRTAARRGRSTSTGKASRTCARWSSRTSTTWSREASGTSTSSTSQASPATARPARARHHPGRAGPRPGRSGMISSFAVAAFPYDGFGSSPSRCRSPSLGCCTRSPRAPCVAIKLPDGSAAARQP
jgi:hypothetical protein